MIFVLKNIWEIIMTKKATKKEYNISYALGDDWYESIKYNPNKKNKTNWEEEIGLKKQSAVKTATKKKTRASSEEE